MGFSFCAQYPENFFILRGNHECASINRIYGFYDECTPSLRGYLTLYDQPKIVCAQASGGTT
jgi:hypothetical protein